MKDVLGRIERRNPDSSSLAALSSVEADLLATVTAKGVIGNGGLDCWYQGKDHEASERAAQGFARLGLSAAADAMRRSLDAFPGRIMTPQDYGRFREAHLAEAQTLWEPLDHVIWRCAWDRQALLYVMVHGEALAETIPAVRRDLARLQVAWELAATRLQAALAVAGPAELEVCCVAIAANDHHAAHAALVAAGPREGQEAPFWAALREVAETLGIDDAHVSLWNHRFLADGFATVSVEVVHANEHGVRLLDSGEARVNKGDTRRWFGAARTNVHAITRNDRGAELSCVYDRGTARLTPPAGLAVGDRIVIHRERVVLARGEVLEVQPGEAGRLA